MNIRTRKWLYITVLALPLFFVLHAVNENFGLIRPSIIGVLFLYYFVISAIVAVAATLVTQNDERAILLTFLLLCIFFFFGAAKDLVKRLGVDGFFTSYQFQLPFVIVLSAAIIFFIKQHRRSFAKPLLFIKTLLAIWLIVEVSVFVYNTVTGKSAQKDLGDIDHSLLNNLPVSKPLTKPFIFWIVMDEYSGNTALKKRWQFDNPLNGILRSEGFFVADSAVSPYNYTHYSLLSTLDMDYLTQLKNHSVIGFRDIVRGNISLHETNVQKFLEANGYKIHNYTIYDIEGHPTMATPHFVNADVKLVDNQTFAGRIRQDIGWNVRNMFSSNKRKADSLDNTKGLMREAEYRKSLIQRCLDATTNAANDRDPSLFMFHFMQTHEPFIYNADGSLDLSVGYGMYPDKYVPSINHANKVLDRFIDSIMNTYKNRDFVIILQGDHGYKYDESDELFDKESCSILFSVYCSDKNYQGWSSSFNSVNTFRLLLNKYFNTRFPLLESRSYNLYYR